MQCVKHAVAVAAAAAGRFRWGFGFRARPFSAAAATAVARRIPSFRRGSLRVRQAAKWDARRNGENLQRLRRRAEGGADDGRLPELRGLGTTGRSERLPLSPTANLPVPDLDQRLRTFKVLHGAKNALKAWRRTEGQLPPPLSPAAYHADLVPLLQRCAVRPPAVLAAADVARFREKLRRSAAASAKRAAAKRDSGEGEAEEYFLFHPPPERTPVADAAAPAAAAVASAGPETAADCSPKIAAALAAAAEALTAERLSQPWRSIEQRTPWEELKRQLVARPRFASHADLFDCMQRLEAEMERRRAAHAGDSPDDPPAPPAAPPPAAAAGALLAPPPPEIREELLFSALLSGNRTALLDALLSARTPEQRERVARALLLMHVNGAAVAEVLNALPVDLVRPRFVESPSFAALLNGVKTAGLSADAAWRNATMAVSAAAPRLDLSEEAGASAGAAGAAIHRLEFILHKQPPTAAGGVGGAALAPYVRGLHRVLALGLLTPTDQVRLAAAYERARVAHTTFFTTVAAQARRQLRAELALARAATDNPDPPTAAQLLFAAFFVRARPPLPALRACMRSSVFLDAAERESAGRARRAYERLLEDVVTTAADAGGPEAADGGRGRLGRELRPCLMQWRRRSFTWGEIARVLNAGTSAGVRIGKFAAGSSNGGEREKTRIPADGARHPGALPADDGRSTEALWAELTAELIRLDVLSVRTTAQLPLDELPPLFAMLPPLAERPACEPAHKLLWLALLEALRATSEVGAACAADRVGPVVECLEQACRWFERKALVQVQDRRPAPIPRVAQVRTTVAPRWVSLDELAGRLSGEFGRNGASVLTRALDCMQRLGGTPARQQALLLRLLSDRVNDLGAEDIDRVTKALRTLDRRWPDLEMALQLRHQYVTRHEVLQPWNNVVVNKMAAARPQDLAALRKLYQRLG